MYSTEYMCTHHAPWYTRRRECVLVVALRTLLLGSCGYYLRSNGLETERKQELQSAVGIDVRTQELHELPRAIARPTAKCVGRAGSRSWWTHPRTHRLLQYVIAAA